MGFPLDDNFVFGDNLFSWLIMFFFAEGDKKNTQPRKKNTHQQTKLLIQRKPHYIFDITFLSPHSFWLKIGKCDLKIELKNMGALHINYETKLSR